MPRVRPPRYRDCMGPRGLLAITVVSATLGSVASGAGASVTKPSLALMPLARSMLGSGALALPLDQDSGVVTNTDVAKNANGKVAAAQLAALGRVTGSQLDHNDAAGHALTSGHGLLEVTTGVDLYRSTAAAGKGLAFWRHDATNLARLRAAGISVSLKAFGVTGLPGPSYAWSGVVPVSGKPPVDGVQISFVSGQLVAGVSVSAADAGSHRAYAVSLAQKLKARIDGVLSKISLKGKKQDNATVFPVEITLREAHGTKLRAGYSANADIIVAQRDSVLTIPERVITFAGDSATVTVVGPDGTKTPRKITTGLSDALNVEVRSGLKLGDRVAEPALREIK